jgi:hypothetical protein
MYQYARTVLLTLVLAATDTLAAASSVDPGGISDTNNPTYCWNETCWLCPDTKEIELPSCSINPDPMTGNQMRSTSENSAAGAGGGGGAALCGSCSDGAGKTGGTHPLGALQVERIHRFREQAYHASLGSGCFLPWDKQITLTVINEAGQQMKGVEIFDPKARNTLRFYPSATSGVFVDAEYNSAKDITLYTSYNVSTGKYLAGPVAERGRRVPGGARR